MSQFDTALFPIEKFSLCPYALFVNDYEIIKTTFVCEVKPQIHNMTYNLKRNL